jgi:cell division inhibitor SulA
MVNYKNSLKTNTRIELAHIKSALIKGNCSAVIVSNSSFATQEIAQLENSAKKGKTQCFLFKNTTSCNSYLSDQVLGQASKQKFKLHSNQSDQQKIVH